MLGVGEKPRLDNKFALFFFPLQQSKWLDADWCGRRIDCWRAIQNVSSVTDPSLSLRRKGVGSKSWSVADLYLFACFLLAFSLSADFASGFTDGHLRWFRLIHAVYAHNKLAAKKPWTRVALSCIWIHLALFFPSPPVLCLTFSSFFLVLLLVRRSYMDVRLHPRRISSGIFLVLFALLLLFRLRLSTSSLFSDFNWHTHTHTRRRSKNTRPFTTVSSSVTAVRWFFNISTAERKKLTWNAHMRTASEKLLRKKDKKDEPYTEILCVCVCYLEQWGKENPIWEYRKKTSWLSSTSLICIWYLHWLFPVSCCFYLRAAHDDPLGGGRGQTVNCISLSLS